MKLFAALCLVFVIIDQGLEAYIDHIFKKPSVERPHAINYVYGEIK